MHFTMKLLIIEDDASLSEIMCRALRSEGYVVKSAATFFDANDYLAKPFYMAELSARIKSVLRRGSAAVSKPMSAGNIELSIDSRRVSVGG